MTDSTSPEKFDLIIIGSGSGNSIPEYLSDWKIALVERDVFGGTCLNRGCIPSKMFVLPADLAVSVSKSEKINVHAEVDHLDWIAARDRVFGRIDPIAAGGRDYRATGTPNVTLIEGTARFIADKTFDVDGRTITADHVLLAAGARPHVPDIAGLADVGYHTSDSIMRVDDFPARLGIIGAGFIAVEMGHVFSAFGSKVTAFSRSGMLLRAFDREISTRFTEVFAERVDIVGGQVPDRVERLADGSIAIHCGSQVTEVDALLVATGRVPNSDLLATDVGNIPTHGDGRVVVNDEMQTAAEGVWAIGDLANDYQLKHLANAEAAIAFWNIAHPDQPRRQSYKAVPGAVFSNPQVAAVGLTEEQAVASGIPIKVGRRDYGGTAYGWAMEDDSSFAKVIVHAQTGLLVGAHIIGPQAATLIQPLIQAMELDQTAEQIARQVFYIHPALTEVVENALLAALDN